MNPSDQPTAFTWNPLDYHVSSHTQHQWGQELIGKLSLSGNERVLDIGCGDGKVTAEIASLVPDGSVTGVDNSPEMIRFARDHYPDTVYKNLTFLEMDASSLLFSEAFDRIYSNAVLHWISDHTPVLAGIATALCPGGRFLIQMGGKGNAEQVSGVMDLLMKQPRWKDYFTGFSFKYGFYEPDEYRNRIREAGFDRIRVDLFPREMTYSTREDFAGWIRSVWLPWLARIPEGERSEFIWSLVDEFIARYPVQDDGLIHIRMVRLEAEGGKR